MTQKRDKRMQPEKYYSLRNLDRIDWANIEQLYVRPATDDDTRSEGCYENQGKVLLVGAEDGQIRNIVDLCGSKLRVLDIKGSMLSGLHLGYMFNLRNLLLQDCSNLTSLPGLENLTQLNELNLQGCDYLTALPGLENLTQLNELNLKGCNHLTALPGLENLTQLAELNLKGCNHLTALPSLDNLTQLTRLNLSECSSLTALPSLDNLTQLTQLNLSECSSLTALPSLDNLKQLTGLSLLGCSSLTVLPESLRNRKSLRCLNLDYLKLTELPDWLPEIAEKFTLELSFDGGNEKAIVSLDGTTVEGVDMSIFEQPYEMVVEWFEKRKAGRTHPLNEIKVVFLGDGEAGKSHTIARLMNDGGELDSAVFDGQSTPGIVIRNKEYDLDGRTITVHYWDFGGQEIMHSMHRLFLTGRTMYVVLLNARDDTKSDRAMYWLHNIRSFAPDAPVILVLNKIDQNPEVVVDERYLRARFPNLTRVVRLSALEFDQERFNREFVDVLLREIEYTGFLDAQWPTAWIKIKNKLETMTSDYIMGDVYQEFCQEAGMDKNRRALLHWFNDLGISFCFCDDEDYGLSDHIVLRPDWITNALYIILFNHLEGASNGLIPHRSIYNILRNAHNDTDIRCTLPQARYTTGDVQYVLGVMRKFNLSFPCGSDQEFIPMLCQRNSMVDIRYYQEDTQILEFNMEFDYLPNNLLHRLMVERHEELDMTAVWRSGARFQLPDLGLSAVVVIEGDTLRFFIRHTDPMHRPNTYLSMLKAHVDRIVAKMGLRAPVCQLIYKLEGKQESFDFEVLKAMQEDGENQAFSMIWRKKIPIADIFNQSAPDGLEDEHKLLEAIKRSCFNIQAEPYYYLRNGETNQGLEEKRNRRIRLDLEMLGYNAIDQTQRGINRTDRGFGTQDILLYNDRRTPWVSINTMSIRDASVSCWNKNLTKLLYNYNNFGMATVFTINFVDCDGSVFYRIWEHYNNHIQQFSPDRSSIAKGSWEVLDGSPDLHYLKAARCIYRIGGNEVTVYHLFVRMPLTDVLAEPEKKPQREDPEVIRNTELVHMEGRVVFLGDSEAGKSLIMNRLREPGMNPAEFSGDTTQGIDIFSEVIQFQGRRIRVNYWDFGGQDVLHSMHRLFLSQQTLYVIVLNTRNDNQDAQADFWMRYVQSYATGAPVLLVMNKVDQNKKAALNLPVLRRRFPKGVSPENVLKISAIEKDPKKFAEQFTNKLHDFIKQNIDRFQGFTTQEAFIRDRVEADKNKTAITRSQFQAHCAAEGLTEKKARDDLIERFHNAGIVVYFKKGTPMYLNPAWITETLYMILSAESEHVSNGIVSHKYLEKMCDENEKSLEGEDDAYHLIRIMQEHGLSFEHGEQEFVPMLCQREEPEKIEDLIQAPGTLEMQLVFEYLPGSLLYKLMVDHQNELDLALTWFTGAKIGRSGENYTVLRRDGNTLCIFVNCIKKEDAVEKIYGIAADVEKLVIDKRYHATIRERKIRYAWSNNVEYFDYDRLKRAKNQDLQYIASKTSDDPVAVCDILEQEDQSERRDLNKLLQLTMEGCLILQDNQTYWWTQNMPAAMEGLLPKMNENARNRALKPVLERGFAVEDQHEGGESAGGIEPGKLDLRICLRSGTPWSILEALNIYEEKGNSRERWLEHLKRLATKYNKSGFKYLILVSYLLSSEEQFEHVKDAYHELLNKTELSEFGGVPTCCKNEPIKNCPQRISVSRADYIGEAGRVSIFHFLVHIPEYKGKQDKKDKPATEK